jgi:methylase of polypeptide subunit release factors
MTLPFYVIARIRGAVYVPSADDRIAAMMKLAKITSKTKVAELGSGDGRVMIAFAKKGAHVTGFEINPILVKKSKKNIARAGFTKQCIVEWKSFWDVDLSEFTTVMIYGIPYIMDDLAQKFRRELKPGCQILSNAFELPGWTPIKKLGEVKEYRA